MSKINISPDHTILINALSDKFAIKKEAIANLFIKMGFCFMVGIEQNNLQQVIDELNEEYQNIPEYNNLAKELTKYFNHGKKQK